MSQFIERHKSVIGPVIGFDTDVQIVASEGVYVTDADGKQYLDFACGIATTNLGHSHPHVLNAIHEQVDKVLHAGGAFRYDSMVRAGERLRDVMPDGIDQVIFMNSGAEAVEASVKLARKTSGRQGVVTFRGGFHGRTMGSVSYTTSKAKYRQGYHPILPSVFVAPFPHFYRWGMTEEEAVAHSLAELDRMFKHEVTPEEVACFLVEPMQGEGGYYPATAEFMQALRERADAHGILLIADEVQSGFGRTGDWFTSQVYGVQPDILVMGKAIANGMPLSAVGASTELHAQWTAGSHGTTFGGNPVSCASSAATVEALTDIVPMVPKLSGHAFDRFAELEDKHPTIGNVRGLGLMIGVELVKDGREPNPEAFEHVSKYALDAGLFVLSCGPDGNIIRFIPPLIVSTEQLDEGIGIIDAALSDYEAG